MSNVLEPTEKTLPPALTQSETNDMLPIEKSEKESHKSAVEEEKDSHKVEMGKKLKGLPPIDLGELNSLLRSPNMPQKKILHEVADKVMSGNERKDGCEMITGMKSLFDCILEVSLQHTESDEEDEDEDAYSLHRKFSCMHCKKVFSSSMAMKTHILIMHSNQDSSVLNLRNRMNNEGQRITPSQRNKSNDSCKPNSNDLKETKSRHPSRGEKTSPKVGDENAPVSRTLSRSLSKGSSKCEEKSTSSTESLVPDNGDSKATSPPPSSIHTDMARSSANPSSVSEETSKDSSSHVSISSPRDESQQSERDLEQRESRIALPTSDESPTKSSIQEGRTRKRQVLIGDEDKTSSPEKRGRRSRSSQGEENETSPVLRRSSRRH